MATNSAEQLAARDCVAAAERELYQAMMGRDFAAMDAILAEDLVYVHSTAVAETREAYLAGVAAGWYEYESIASRSPRIRIAGDMAAIDGIVDMRVGETGRPKDLLHLLFTLVWVHRDGRWQLYYRQATRMPD